MKRLIIGLILITLLLSLSACKESPTENIIVSKNDGAFDAAIIQTDDSKKAENVQSYSDIEYLADYYSSDNSVHFSFTFLNNLSFANHPVLQVAPHFIDQNESQRIAKVLFGNLDLFEYSFVKPTPEDKLLFWGKLANDDDVLMDLYGNEFYNEAKLEINNLISSRIKNSVVTEAPRKPCDWTFYPEEHYLLAGTDGNNMIIASANKADINYIYWVSNRDENDYRIHNVTAYISSEYSSPWDIETLYTIRKLCGYSKPDNSDIEAVEKKASDMIQNMDIGEWSVSCCEARVYPYWRNEESPAYVINVYATPVYNNIPTLLLPQLGNLKSDDIYSSNYYYTQLCFSFSKSGDLISFSYTSPVDVVSIINENVSILSLEEAINSAASHLQYTDAGAYDILLGNQPGTFVEANVDEINLGLARVKIKENANDFYLVPAAQLRGDYSVYVEGTEVYSYSGAFEEKASFIVINLIDGSIINVSLGY